MEEKKTVTISLYRKEIFYDMDASSYKMVDASMEGVSPKSRNAIQSDVSDTLDGSIMKRLADKRDSQLRMRLMWCLKGKDIDHADNCPREDDTYEYVLEVEKDFSGDRLKVLASKMHEYIVSGALLDWYKRCGIRSAITEQDVADMEQDIVSLVRPSSGRRPMQPFGPAERTY